MMNMRTFSRLSALAVTAALLAPLAQVAFADQPEQQARMQTEAVPPVSHNLTGTYDTPAFAPGS